MQESNDSNTAAEEAENGQKDEPIIADSDAEENGQTSKKKKNKENQSEEMDSGDSETVTTQGAIASTPVDELEAAETVEAAVQVSSEVTEVTAVSDLESDSVIEDEPELEGSTKEESKEEVDEHVEKKPKKPPIDETDVSLTDDIGDSVQTDIGSGDVEVKAQEKDKGSFLELDTETRHRKDEIEESERLAEEAAKEAEEEEELHEVGIFAVKTSIGHEKMVANWLAIRARKRKMDVFAILSPPKLRGYLLLEGVKNKEALQDMIKGVQHARSVVDGYSSIEEIEHFLTPKPLVSGIEEGDVVEIIAGPFKGEKAKVTQIDESKEEITVELFEAMVSIPVTIRGDHVRILEKEAKQ